MGFWGPTLQEIKDVVHQEITHHLDELKQTLLEDSAQRHLQTSTSITELTTAILQVVVTLENRLVEMDEKLDRLIECSCDPPGLPTPGPLQVILVAETHGGLPTPGPLLPQIVGETPQGA